MDVIATNKYPLGRRAKRIDFVSGIGTMTAK